jgi:predicted dehydrogenase
VRLKGTYIARETVPAYILHGRRGSFLKSRSDVQEAHLQAGLLPGTGDWGREPASEQGILHTATEGGILREMIKGENGNYMEFYNQLYASIREGSAVPVSAADGTHVIRVIDAAFKSNERRAVVDL